MWDKEKVIQFLEKGSTPKVIIKDMISLMNNQQEAIEKFGEDKISNLMNSLNYKVYFYIGSNSPDKDLLIAFLLSLFILQQNKTILFMTANQIIESNNPLPKVGVYAIIDLDCVAKNELKTMKIINFIKQNLREEHIMVISCSDTKKIEEIYGSDFLGYISHSACIVESPVTKIFTNII